MRAVVMLDHRLELREVDVPEPAAGQVLARTLACGICGSDLHALVHTEKLVEIGRRCGGTFDMDLTRGVVMGHEFCAEIVDHGPGTERALPVGSIVCSMPLVIGPSGMSTVGYSNDDPGGYGDYMRLTEQFLLPVPNGLPPERAALTEPMAVGVHAVAKARLDRSDVPLVVGCGPVGLAVIAALKLAGAGPIVAADYSPRRRELAAAMGADEIVDPRAESPYGTWARVAPWADPDAAPPQAPWVTGPALRPAVIFECVGVPGVLDEIVSQAPTGARVVVAGVCMERDHFEPMYAINKELNLQYVLGYSADEFASTLRHIAEGDIDVSPLVTGRVDLEHVAAAFAALATPERHAKVLVRPGSGCNEL
jgi:threonine dehydrogenase-like Zn-dependent dehydrogenase